MRESIKSFLQSSPEEEEEEASSIKTTFCKSLYQSMRKELKVRGLKERIRRRR